MKNDSEKPGKSRLTYEEVQQFISKQLDEIEKNTGQLRDASPSVMPRTTRLRRILQKLKRKRK